MVRYVIRRLLITIPIIVAVAIIVFTLMYFVPGDPAVLILGEAASEEELAAMREYLGINRPYIVQLLDYLKQLFIDFDLGESWIYKTNISTELYNRMPTTFAICVYSILVSACLGIPLGVMAAVHRDRWQDKLVLWMSSIFTCVPNYCWALLFIVVFALNLGWFPIYGVSAGWRSYVLPCLSILMGSFTGLARQTRSSMLEVIRSDYVTSARVQGYSRNTVYYLHALPNALIPIITILGTQFAAGLGGTLILETIFSIPGVGLYVTGAITKRDYPAVMGCVVFLAILFCLIMLGVDILYALVDPRVRAQYEARGSRRRHKKAWLLMK
ncbi:MAG: ABC transporter permease [Clostridiales bacterium]|nr:ABC transporter permease [Clostridiales bacterium]